MALNENLTTTEVVEGGRIVHIQVPVGEHYVRMVGYIPNEPNQSIPPVTIIPGAWHGSSFFQTTQAYLVKNGITSFAIDLQGREGASFAGEVPQVEFSEYMEAIQNCAGEVIKMNEGKPITIVGHSLGGMMAQIYTLDNPEKIFLMGLIASYPVNFTIGDILRLLKNNWRKLGTIFKVLGSQGYVLQSPENARSAFFSDQMTDEELEQYFKQLNPETPFLSTGVTQAGKDHDNAAKLPHENPPVGVFEGFGKDGDILSAPNIAQTIQRTWTNSQLLNIPNAPHDMFIDPSSRDEFLRLFTEWLLANARGIEC